jgi:hypothetical protein
MPAADIIMSRPVQPGSNDGSLLRRTRSAREHYATLMTLALQARYLQSSATKSRPVPNAPGAIHRNNKQLHRGLS